LFSQSTKKTSMNIINEQVNVYIYTNTHTYICETLQSKQFYKTNKQDVCLVAPISK